MRRDGYTVKVNTASGDDRVFGVLSFTHSTVQFLGENSEHFNKTETNRIPENKSLKLNPR